MNDTRADKPAHLANRKYNLRSFPTIIKVSISFILGFQCSTIINTHSHTLLEYSREDLTVNEKWNNATSDLNENKHNSTQHIQGKEGSRKSYQDILKELDVLSGGAKSSNLECVSPLVPFHNILAQNLNETVTKYGEKESRIPKILHISMKSRCLPQDIATYIEQWKTVLPNYSIIFHDDEAVERLITQEWPEFPDLQTSMKCILYKGAMKIDIWRVLILYKYGGIYTDLDVWPLDTFNETSIRTPDLSAFFLTDSWNRPSQWFMVLEPYHPIMSLAMGGIIRNVLLMPNIHNPRVTYITGPNAVKEAYLQFLFPLVMNMTETNNQARDLLLRSDIQMKGLFKKVVMKTDSRPYIVAKKGYSDIVPFNSTMNVTREQRIRMESGVNHWQRVKRPDLKPHLRRCSAYLDALDKGLISKVEQVA
jgi:mannosyltransferase OCH1-like enzyme